MSSCWPLFIGSCTGSGETAYEGALCRGSRGLLLVLVPGSQPYAPCIEDSK